MLLRPLGYTCDAILHISHRVEPDHESNTSQGALSDEVYSSMSLHLVTTWIPNYRI